MQIILNKLKLIIKLKFFIILYLRLKIIFISNIFKIINNLYFNNKIKTTKIILNQYIFLD